MHHVIEDDRLANRIIVAVTVIGALLNVFLINYAGLNVLNVAFRAASGWLIFGILISLSRLSGYNIRPLLILLVVAVSAIAFFLNASLGTAAAASV